MKFTLLLALAAVVSIEARELPDQLDHRELHRLDTDESEEEIFHDALNSATDRAVCDKPKLVCALTGGKCINRNDECDGIKDSSGCSGNRCACCAPLPIEEPGCPIEDGFFIPTGSRQCFKFFPQPGRNWMEANSLCTDKGLVLAHPYDSLGLRDYLLQRYGRWAYVWVNACGDDSEIIWQDNGKMLGQDSPLWRPNEPKNLSPDYCLVLSASDINWQNIPDHIYSVYNRTDKFQVLCEFPLAAIPPTPPPPTNSSTAICDPSCLNGGTCVAPDTCDCTDEWDGNICQDRKCPADFTPVGSQCFMNVRIVKTWDEARLYCQNMSADLAQPNDLDALRTFLNDQEVLTAPSWLGAKKEGDVHKWLNGTEITTPLYISQRGDGCVYFVATNSINSRLIAARCFPRVFFVCETI